MIILITYNDDKLLAKVTADHEVMLLGVENEELIDVKLDQCKGCGVWVSEDEELYGDGYCTKCASMCYDCEQYFHYKDMIPIGGKAVLHCKKCSSPKSERG